MKFKDAVRVFRREMGLTQVELATALNINAITVGRWESGRTAPSRAIASALLDYARSKGTSKRCLDFLSEAIASVARARLDFGDDACPVETYEQLKEVFENINGGVSVVVYDDDGDVRLTYANSRYFEIFGYTKEQFVTELQSPGDTVYRGDAEMAGGMIESVKRTRQPVSFRYRAVKRDGSITYIRCSSSVSSILGLGDKVLISVLTDVSAVVAAEREALISGQRLSAIMGNINNGVAASILRDDGFVDYVFVTDRYYEILGYTREQYRAEVSDPFDLITDEYRDEVRAKVSSLKSIGELAHLEYRALRRDRSTVCLSVDIRMMSFADVSDRPVMLSVFTDVTGIVQANERLSEQRDEINEMLNTAPSGIAVIELDPRDIKSTLRTVYYNDRFFSFSGCTREEYDELLKHDEMVFVYEEDVPCLLADTLKMCEGGIGDSASSTVRCHTKDGGYRWLLFTGQLSEIRGETYVVKLSVVDVTERKDAEDRRRISEEMLRIAAEADKRAIITYNIKANTCHVESRSLYSSSFGETIANPAQSLIKRGTVSPESESELIALFGRIRSGEAKAKASLRLRAGENDYQWFECNATTVFDADGKPDQAVLVFHNITEQRIKEAVFRKWQQSIETRPPETFTLFRCNLNRNATLDEREGSLLKIEFDSEALTFNARTAEYADRYVLPEDRKAYADLLNSDTLLAMFYRNEHSATLDYREMDGGGSVSWRRLTVETVEYLNSTDVQAFLMYEDIDEAKRAEEKARELAEIDPLTNSLNRAAFAGRIDALTPAESVYQHALLMLDMDGFKQLNDSFGHAAGDKALQDVAAVLRSFSRPGDLVCRLGGDEFLVFLRDVPYDAVISKLAQQMCEQIHKAYKADVEISASIGIAVYPRDGHGFDELYRNADKALYRVKQSKKGGYAFFSAATDEQTAESDEALSEISRELQKPPRIKQRILVVDDNEVNRVVLKGIFKDEYIVETAKNGTEALMRMRHFGSSVAVVLLDLFMPGMDGFEVLKRITANVEMRTVPVIVVSGDSNKETYLKAISLGAIDYLTKPVDFELTRLRVKAAIARAENERLIAQNSYLQLQRDEETKFRMVLESTGTVVVEYDWRNHVFIYDNEISKYIAGKYDHRGLWQIFLSDMVASTPDVKRLQESMLELANCRGKTKEEHLILLKTPDYDRHWFRMCIYKGEDTFGLADKMIITFNDVHEEVKANERLLFQATRDELTGLYNRAGFIEKATELIKSREAGYYSLACIDIDKFKVINDQYGTKTGDNVLKRFAFALDEMHKGEAGICCRVTADIFAVLYPGYLLDDAHFDALKREMGKADGSLPGLKFSVGRCVIDDVALPVNAIYDRAAIAKDTIKGRYDAYIATYDESMRTVILRQQEIAGQMKHALESGQFEVWLQPQFNHATRTLSGAEALVRWRHPEEGIISPAEFIPIFERNGFVYEVDKFVWERTCALLRKWLDMKLDPVPVSVNVSRYDVFRDDLIDVISGLVKKYRLPADLLRLEVTESAFSESTSQIIRVVKRLVDKGFIVEIDDFGSGYSSLNTLKDFPAQVLKMDMRFLENDTNAQRGGSIIESVVRMAHWLGMSVIAEGVETIEQADYLKSIGCECIQGYLYSKPLPVCEYEKLFSEGGIEKKLSGISSVETWNNNAFWNPKSMETLIFNSYIGGACIFEYCGGKTELLRYNDAYSEIFGSRFCQHIMSTGQDILTLLDRDNAALISENIKLAIDTKKEASCTCKAVGDGGNALYIRTTIRQIARAGDRHLFYCVVYDITAQRVAEQQQIKSSARLKVIMDNMGGGVAASVVRNGKICYLFANDRYYELLGYEREAYTSQFTGEFNAIHPDDKERVNAAISKASADGQPYSLDFRIVRRDGEIRWIACNINIIALPDTDEPVHLAAVSDTTELHEAQRRESVASKQMNTIMAHIIGGITATVFRGMDRVDLLFANDGFYALYGYTKQQWEAEVTDILNLILPEDLERTMSAVARIVKTRGSETYEYRCIRRDGSVMWTQATNTVVSLDGVGDTVLLAVATDVTELRTSQQRYSELSDKLKAILNSAENGVTAVVLCGDKTEYLLVNSKYYEIMGISENDYPRDRFSDAVKLVHPDDREEMSRSVLNATHAGEKTALEFRVIRPNGRIIWVKAVIHTVTITGIDSPVQVTVYIDVTAQRNYTVQLQYLNESAHDILMQTDTGKALSETLSKLLCYHNADRGYVVEFDYGSMVSYNTYEVCAAGIESEKQRLQSVPFNRDDLWYKSLLTERFFCVEDASALGDDKADLRELLVSQGIRSLIIAPLYCNAKLIGFAGLDNPRIHLAETERLFAMSDYLSILLIRRNVTQKRERDAKTISELMNGTPGGFVRMRVSDGGLVVPEYFNEGFRALTGMSGDELMRVCGGDAMLCVHKDDYERVNAYRLRLLRDGSAESIRFRHINGSGGYTYVSFSARVVRDDSGNRYINSYYTDATALFAEEEMQRNLLDNLTNGVALYEYDGKRLKVIHINASYWKLIGRAPVDYSNADVISAVHPDDRQRLVSELDDCLRERRNFRAEIRILNGENGYTPFDINASVSQKVGGVYLFYATYTPISQK